MSDESLKVRALRNGVPIEMGFLGLLGGLMPSIPVIAGGQQTTLGVALASIAEKQDGDAVLTALAALALAPDRLIYATGSETLGTAVLTAFGRSLLDDANAAAARTTLGLGSAATLTAGTAAGNVPVLGADSKLLASLLPAIAITDTFEVASQAEMLALANTKAGDARLPAERGDVAVRSDLSRAFILKAEPASTLANWVELKTPADAVLSVAGLTGTITAAQLKTALALLTGDVSGLDTALGNRLRVDAAQGLTAAQIVQALTNLGVSTFVRGLLDDADAATARATLGLATPSFRNRIVNGDFRINQRSAAAASTAYPAGAYILDRWKAGPNGVTLSFAVSAGDVTVTVAAGTLLQVIEGAFYMPDSGVYQLSWKGTAQARVYQGGNPGYSVSPIATGLGGGINTTVEFGAGTISQVQFELGSTATAFERRDDEMDRCQRYGVALADAQNVGGAAAGADSVLARFALPVEMRAAGSVTLQRQGSFTITDDYVADVTASSIGLGVSSTSRRSARVLVSGFSGLTQGRFYSSSGAQGSASIFVSAEI